MLLLLLTLSCATRTPPAPAEPAWPEGAQIIADRIPHPIRELVLFPPGTAAIPEAHRDILVVVAEVMAANPRVRLLEVQGHAAASEGTAQQTLALSIRRAEAAHAVLLAEGVSPHRMVTRGYGETMPLDPSDEALSRRIDFVILARDAE